MGNGVFSDSERGSGKWSFCLRGLKGLLGSQGYRELELSDSGVWFARL